MNRFWVFDLDGTLIDVRPRYLNIHQDIVRELGGTPLIEALYWELKRSKTPEEDIAKQCGLAGKDLTRYCELRIVRLENSAYLAKDALFESVRELLGRIGKARVFLVTKRKNHSALMAQLSALGIDDCFREILTSVNTITKADLYSEVLREIGNPGGQVVSVTDSPQDIRDSKGLGFFRVAVLSGLRNASLLGKENPDLVLNGVGDLLDERLRDAFEI